MTQAPHETERHVFWLDDATVDAFVAGTLDAEREVDLARQVAPLVPDHHALPNHTVASLSRLTHHLGGPGGVLAWLDRFEGQPRVVSRVVAVGDLFERFSDDPDVMAAVRATRHSSSDPPGLVGHIVFDTDEGTLASVAHDMEMLAADGRTDEALHVAIAAVELFERTLPHLRTDSSAAAVLTPSALASLRARLEEVL
jgi:hypothetical protein